MKEGIHPKYEQTTIRCACGNVFTTGSTKKDIRVEICSKCHPFYTGKQKLVDTGGRVDRFNKRFGLKSEQNPHCVKWCGFFVYFCRNDCLFVALYDIMTRNIHVGNRGRYKTEESWNQILTQCRNGQSLWD